MGKLTPARAEKKYSCWICLVPPWGFTDLEEEQLYSAYTHKQRERVIPRLLAAGILLQAFAAIVPGERDLRFAYTSVVIALLVNMSLTTLYAFVRRLRPILTHFVWLVLWCQLLLSASRRLGDSYNELLGWALMLQYFTLAALPFHYVLLTFYSSISFIAYLLVQYYNALTSESRLPDDFVFQQIANGALLVGATLLGGTVYSVGERQQRSSFQETKRSLRDKLTIEQQSKEQERLLLSVLPEHVAVQMRQDLGLIDTQFKKIYMSRHENVRSSRASYVENAVGYVEVKRTGNICHVRAKVSPEHKLSSKYYVAEVGVDESKDTILDATCDGCAAAAGGCKHTLVFLYWLQKQSSEPEPTSMQCYWKKRR